MKMLQRLFGLFVLLFFTLNTSYSETKIRTRKRPRRKPTTKTITFQKAPVRLERREVCSQVKIPEILNLETPKIGNLNYDRILNAPIDNLLGSFNLLSNANISTFISNVFGQGLSFNIDSISYTGNQANFGESWNLEMKRTSRIFDEYTHDSVIINTIWIEGTLQFGLATYRISTYFNTFNVHLRSRFKLFGSFPFESRNGIYLGSGLDYYNGGEGNSILKVDVVIEQIVNNLVVTFENGDQLDALTEDIVSDFLDNYLTIFLASNPTGIKSYSFSKFGLTQSQVDSAFDDIRDAMGVIRTRGIALDLGTNSGFTNFANLETIWISKSSGAYICDNGYTTNINWPYAVPTGASYRPSQNYVEQGINY